MEQIVNFDKELFLYLNGINSNSWDIIMYWISYKWTWIPLYAYLIYFLVVKRIPHIWILLGCIVGLIASSDLISVHLFKNVFQRYRPCHNEIIGGMVHLVEDHCGGLYGFVSSHASTSFSIAVFIEKFLPNKIAKYAILIWAGIVAYSRVYLGVHYPLDIVCGIILGIGIANLWHRIYYYFSTQLSEVSK
ncbi:MAG: phosphatase PAP2 family protein [Flavobacteriales bacterium]|nr:phosphatase PAP2 family protein [Flavobacteriales bacterium]